MNRINWTAVIIFSLIVLIAFFVGVNLFGGWGYGGWGMMGPGRMGPDMMNRWGFGSFGWFGMIFMWLIPVGLVVLIVAGVIWIVRSIGTSAGSNSPGRTCPNCTRTVQADWRTCPYCGQALE